MNFKDLKEKIKGILPLLTVIVLTGCGNNNTPGEKQKPKYDTPSFGRIVISVDESFKPIIDSQIKVYKASFPETEIVAYYKPEAECLKDLEVDSVRMVIVTRGLSAEETQAFEDRIKFKPSWGLLAYDAVAVVANKKEKNNVLSLIDLRNMLDGSIGGDYEVVLDGLSATSTVRYAIDSILKGKALGPKVQAAKSSQEVINYVEKSPKAIGLIGVSWVGNRKDDSQLSFVENVKLMSLKCETCPEDAYVLPYQANIALGRYPMTRGIFYILKENYEGLGRGFVNFLIYERGQLIFKRAFLLPARMDFGVRTMQVTEK
jgi:phosphate transport system substrate-binding protein